MSNSIEEQVRARWDSLTKPRGSLGVLEDHIVKLAQIQGTARPKLNRRAMYVFCGDHGITEEGVSLYSSVVTREMVKNFIAGGAAINVLCRQLNIYTSVIDAGVAGSKLAGVIDRRIGDGTDNFRHRPAMTRQQAQGALDAGGALAADAAKQFDIAGVGEMGIGNSTSASAVLCALTGLRPHEATGRGTGLDDTGVQHKQRVIEESLAARDFDRDDPLSVIAAFAGFETAMMAGFILGAASAKMPVVIDGFISGSAFLIAQTFSPVISDTVFFAHRSAEHGHKAMLAAARAKPLLDLEMRLGEGTGAALAIGLLDSALHLYNEMATFAEASVSDSHIAEGTNA